MGRVVIVRPAAKVNLSLHVGAVERGYHDVRTVLQSIALHDTLTVTARRGPFGLSSRTPGVPDDRTNLVWRAALALWQASGRTGEPRDAHVRLSKRIPAAAGLGGGSADAAGALVALNAVWDLKRTPRDLASIGSSLGADVPFFLVGGTAIGLGRGDEVYPLEDARPFSLLVVKPSIAVPTSDAYRWLDEDRSAGTETPGQQNRIDLGWPTGPLAVTNDLQAPVARRHPVIDEAIDALQRQGATTAAMTGSGSAVFGVFSESQASRVARRIARPDWLVLVTRTMGRRETARRMGLGNRTATSARRPDPV